MKPQTTLLLTALLCTTLASQRVSADSNLIQISPQQLENLGITVGALHSVTEIPFFSAPAKVIVPPANDFIVSTTQAGLVIKMNKSVGDQVTKGQVLGVISSPEILTLQGNYLKALSTYRLTSATYQRDKTLRKEGVVSGRGEQESYSRLSASEIELLEAKQRLQLAGLNVSEIKKLEHSGQLFNQISIKSPTTGVVIDRMAVSGSRVDALTPLYRVANLNELWLEINIPHEHINAIEIGSQVQSENGLLTAKIKGLSQSINPENQSILAKAMITGNPSAVRVGQKLTVQLIQHSGSTAYLIPDSAVAHHEGKSFIFIRNQNGFQVTEVTMTGKQSGSSIISGNLTGNEEIAVDNAVVLKANWLGLRSSE